MKLKVNGKDESLNQNSPSVLELLKIFNVSQPEMVSVQLNGEFVKREDFGKTRVKDADEIDFLYFMGGGQE